MAKVKTKWVCQECGYEAAGYLGKCPDCSSWGSLKEEKMFKKSDSQKQEFIENFDSYIEPQPLNDIEITEEIRFSAGYDEFDRVLGKGIVQNSLVLIGGDPGIGKSTILLQTCGRLSAMGHKTLYISAEESPKQIKLRASRLGIESDCLYVYAQTNINNIMEQAKELKPAITIIDSIQAIYDPELNSSPGSISQVRECSNRLLGLAKFGSGAVFIIGHVTKEGAIAGPKVLEHIVDTVLYLEGDSFKTYRILRTVKNRFGSTNEIGVFNMTDAGMDEVSNPSEIFLSQRAESASPGNVIVVTMEGTRPLLVEVQSLVGFTSYASPRRVATGLNYNRLLQIIAVLENRVGLSLSKYDVYTSIAGGLKIDEPSADLGLALAIVSSSRGVVVDRDTAIVGEIGLTGEIRAVNNIEQRISEAAKQGFKRIIIPEANSTKNNNNSNIEIIPVKRLVEAISNALNG